MKISKEEFYEVRGNDYVLSHPEASIRYKRILKWLDLQPGMAICEIGCMFAIIRNLVQRTDVEYTGVDINEKAIKSIPGYCEDDYIIHNANEGLPFSDGTKDYIVALEVMEHLENPSYFLEEVKRVLKPEGKLIISVPNPYCLNELMVNMRHAEDTEGHIGSYTHQNINALLNFSGLKLYDSQGTYFRVPLLHRLTQKHSLIEANNLFLTRSYMFLIGR